jgi:hypothetical protein
MVGQESGQVNAPPLTPGATPGERDATLQDTNPRREIMTKQEAIQFVRDHSDQDNLADDDLAPVYTALYGREPDDQDREEGLWSHCCAAAGVAK